MPLDMMLSRRRGRHCRLRAFPAGPQSGPVSGHAPARGAKVYERNQRILQGIYEVTGDLPEELMGRDRGQCVVRISCARGGVGSSISGAPHGSEWMSRYLLFSFQWTFVFVPVDLCAPVPRDLCAFLNATLRQYRRTTVRF